MNRKNGLFLWTALFFVVLMICPIYADPWRDIDSIPAGRITWMGLDGIDGEDKTHLYSIKAQGSIARPYPKKPPYPVNVQERVESWLADHPRARIVPVEAYPFFSATVARVYVWIVDGDENLNVRLVAEGFFRASTQQPIMRREDLLVSYEELKAFREKIIAAEIAAADAKNGIWAQAEREDRWPPGELIYPGRQELAKYEAMAEKESRKPPPLAYGPDVPEGELLDICFGEDKTKAYAANQEINRRAESGELSEKAFTRLISSALDQQYRWARSDSSGTLIHLAHQQGKLDQKLLLRYARQAVTIAYRLEPGLLQPSRPYVDFTVERDGRFAVNDAPRVLKDAEFSGLLMTAAFHVGKMEIDGAPALYSRTGKPINKTWFYQAWRGHKIIPIQFYTDPSIPPGPHTLSGVLILRVFTGAAAWNAAGNKAELPDGIVPLFEERYDIEMPFVTQDYPVY